MSWEKLLIGGMAALLALVCIKFPVWGVIELERKLDFYPIVSSDTVAMMDEMKAALADFGEACEAHQYAEGHEMNFSSTSCEYEAGYRSCPYGEGEYEDCREWEQENPVKTCKEQMIEIANSVEEATNDMYAAVARRKAISAKADFGLLKTMTLGTNAYTHSTWLCAPAYASFSTQINMGFSPTYDPPA
ncbi:MAG: hypothetical protein WC654_01595 [Patescibacteria group bacterium]